MNGKEYKRYNKTSIKQWIGVSMVKQRSQLDDQLSLIHVKCGWMIQIQCQSMDYAHNGLHRLFK